MATKEYLDLEGLTYFKEKQDLQNASTYATTSYVNTLVGSSVASAYKFKGSKDTVDSLPSTGNTVGDVWNVTATGMNYAWDGSAWDALGTSYSEATTSAAGLMSASDKTKLDGVATGANKYTHPTTAGNKHIPSGGSAGQILRWSAAGTAVWGADNDTTYDAATSSAAGLMSAADKAKLDGVATGANAYTHPSHAAKSSGLYKVTVDSQGHVSAATAVAKSDITALGIPAQDTTYSDATTSASGLMTAAMVTKLNGIAEGATKVTVDSALSSSSTNPVQNKVVNTALAAKAPLASPALTGTPTAPTAASGTSTTQIATTAFVQAATEPIATSVIDALFS